MTCEEKYAPAPWEWVDFGVLADSNGEPVLDYEDWNVTPENAVLMQRAPELYECLRKIRADNSSNLPNELVAEIDRVLALATQVRK